MDVINNKYSRDDKINKYFKNTNICFLDIETTGFSRTKNIIYLVGVMYKANDYWYVKQFFANNFSEEKNLIIALANFLKPFDTIVTYNGDNFDISFLNYKFKKYNIEYSIYDIDSFDIYKTIKKENLFLILDSLKLESVEEFVGINRIDTLSGKDCIASYYQYLNTKNENHKNLILQHNYEDLIYLPKVLKIFDIIEKEKTVSILLKDEDIDIIIETFKTKGDMLEITCYQKNSDMDPIIFNGKNYNINWIPNNNHLSIEIEFKEGLLSTNETCLYIDNKNNLHINNIEDESKYNLPKHLIPIKIDKNFQINNIKNLIRSIMESILENQ